MGSGGPGTGSGEACSDAATVQTLRELKRMQPLASDRVFANRRGRAAFPGQAFEQAVREARIDDLRFHDLRHTFASYLPMSGRHWLSWPKR